MCPEEYGMYRMAGTADAWNICTNEPPMDQHYTRPFNFLLAFALGPLLNAQTLTDATSVPVIGHAETRTYYALFGTVSIATSGTGNVWDATAATPFGLSSAVTYTVPGESPYAASHPTSNLCMHRVDGTDEEWRHYRVTSDTAELLSANVDVFDGGRTMCVFPFSMGGSFTDTYSISGGSPNTETDEYVASGEITAPWGTIPNVVMFSVNGGLSYYFYTADNVLDAVGTYTPGFGVDLWHVESNTEVAEEAPLRIGLFPVPAHDVVTMALPFTTDARMEVIDAAGRVVKTWRTAVNARSIDVSAFAPGCYTLSAVGSDGRRASGRFIKQ